MICAVLTVLFKELVANLAFGHMTCNLQPLVMSSRTRLWLKADGSSKLNVDGSSPSTRFGFEHKNAPTGRFCVVKMNLWLLNDRAEFGFVQVKLHRDVAGFLGGVVEGDFVAFGARNEEAEGS